jgi:hypothetical protein
MKTVANKTAKPLSIRLPRGKTLHLGPRKTAQISSNAVEHPQVKKLVAAGEIEIADEPPRPAGGIGGGREGRTSIHGYGSSGRSHRSGDR